MAGGYFLAYILLQRRIIASPTYFDDPCLKRIILIGDSNLMVAITTIAISMPSVCIGAHVNFQRIPSAVGAGGDDVFGGGYHGGVSG